MVANNEYSYIEEKYTNLTWQNMFRICIIKHNEETRTYKKEEDVETTFLPTNISEIHLHVEQLLQNTY